MIMGLDMYLTGRKFFGYNSKTEQHEGFEVETIIVAIGYWRKHPDLHSFIVGNYGPEIAEGVSVQASATGADGVERNDNCEDIELNMEQIGKIVEAIKADALNHGSVGFFFGESPKNDDDGKAEYEAQQKEDLEIFAKAAAWLTDLGKQDGVYRSVVYRASW